MIPDISDDVSKFIADITSMTTEPVEVWLMGSRANGRARHDSDTDLLVFGPDKFLEMLRDRLQQPNEIDCLVVYDGDNYQDPWQQKSGSLSKLRWLRINEHTATYVGTKWVPDDESSLEFEAELGDLVEHSERSCRLWP